MIAPWATWQWLPWAAAGVAGLAVAAIATVASASTTEDRIVDLKGKSKIVPYLDAAEKASGIEGLAAFGLATAKRESGLSLAAENRSEGESKAARKAWLRNREKFAGSPFDDDEHFAWGSGGWFGLLPGNAFAGDVFNMMDPIVAIHDPAITTAAWSAFVQRVIARHLPRLPPEHRNWLSIRRAMASLVTMYDFEEKNDRARAVKERLAKDLRAVGLDPDLMYVKPSAKGWPGSAAVLAALQGVQRVS